MYWPSMADDVNDVIIEATAGTADSLWGKNLIPSSIILIIYRVP